MIDITLDIQPYWPLETVQRAKSSLKTLILFMKPNLHYFTLKKFFKSRFELVGIVEFVDGKHLNYV